jgi:hypothetical protein
MCRLNTETATQSSSSSDCIVYGPRRGCIVSSLVSADVLCGFLCGLSYRGGAGCGRRCWRGLTRQEGSQCLAPPGLFSCRPSPSLYNAVRPRRFVQTSVRTHMTPRLSPGR